MTEPTGSAAPADGVQPDPTAQTSAPTPPAPPAPYPTAAYPAYPGGPGYPGYPGYPAGPGTTATVPPPRKRRALLITMIVLSVVLVLCGGGGTAAYFLVNQVDGKGQTTPEAAVDGFLTAVFKDQNVDKATTFVCSEARDKTKLTRKIEELKSYRDKYPSPEFSWTRPTVQSRNAETATLTVAVRFAASDERVAEQRLKFLTVKDAGWWVCEVSDAG